MSKTALQVCNLLAELAPLGSTRLRPCRTPFINVSCERGVHRVEMLEPFRHWPAEPALRRENRNSRSVARTANG